MISPTVLIDFPMAQDTSSVPEVLLFDLDDTLIDWWGSISRCLEQFAAPGVLEALQDHARESCWHRHHQYDYVVQRDTWKLHEFRHEHWPVALHWLDDELRADHMHKFEETLWVDFFPEVVASLETLRKNHRLVVLSNNPYVEREARRLNLHTWFESCMSAAFTTPKPHPNAFLDACSQIGVHPSRAWYVGDSIRADVHGASSAGLTPVWVDRWNDEFHDRPAHVVRVGSLDELVEVLATFR
jgi:putative hydrolase of the HAD superfamily